MNESLISTEDIVKNPYGLSGGCYGKLKRKWGGGGEK